MSLAFPSMSAFGWGLVVGAALTGFFFPLLALRKKHQPIGFVWIPVIGITAGCIIGLSPDPPGWGFILFWLGLAALPAPFFYFGRGMIEARKAEAAARRELTSGRSRHSNS